MEVSVERKVNIGNYESIACRISHNFEPDMDIDRATQFVTVMLNKIILSQLKEVITINSEDVDAGRYTYLSALYEYYKGLV